MQGFYEHGRDQINTLYYYKGVNSCVPHFHKQIEILHMTCGEAIVKINDESRVVHAGDTIISDSYDVHSYKPVENYSSFVMIFPFYLLKNYFIYKKDKSLASNFIIKNAESKRILHIMTELSNTENPLLVSGLTDTLLYLLTSKTGFIKKETSNDDIIREILLYVEQNYASDITLTNLAKHFSYSPSHFSHLFNANFETSINEYVNSVRITKLMELKSHDLSAPIAALAFEVGFNSLPTFYRAFTKQTSTTPEKYYKSDIIPDPKEGLLD